MVVSSFPPAPTSTHLVTNLAPAPVMTTLPPPAPAMTLVPTPAAAAFPAPTSSSNNIPECMMYKSLLNQHIQKESLPPVTYRTLNEGFAHLPRFRSTVLVGEEQFTSPNVFLRRKEAEQDAAKIALECLRKRIKEKEVPLIYEQIQGTVFCKSILNEYAVKRQLERPVYNTIQSPGYHQSFLSSLVFNGITYVGKNARTKKEAEQLAAQSVILALIGTGDSTSSTPISEIIKSKSKLFAALPKSNDCQNAGTVPIGNDNEPTVAISQGAPEVHPPTVAISQGAPEVHPPHNAFAAIPTREAVQGVKPVAEAVHRVKPVAEAVQGVKPVAEVIQRVKPVAEAVQEGMKPPIAIVPTTVEQSPDIPHHAFSVPKGEAIQDRIELPIAFVPPIVGPSADAGQTSGKRRRKSKKKAEKKMRTES